MSESFNPEPTVVNVTDALPTSEPKTRSYATKFATFTASAAALALLVDAGVRKLKREKTVKVVVTDNSPVEDTSTSS